ncbi:LysR family transcriptional regulator [Roseomonas frigidaquae]|uniref:LysR family transcriptional regulator n=1 Tax=Falsiroseomonas frigidaquae TaxID=487318 RepID=A0ABX1ETE3_9PROT|nr:LysR family transcriptional regulator [Falsiroseomonas frigidaquae]NKE43785.1 LysR family transcriptional regulator [Falsiroseomonas frigidaquae]
MDLRELRSFIHVARLGSVSAAAKELRIAQPALSRQIRKLEEELGVALMLRGARGVELTAAGTVVLRRAELLLRSARQIKDEVAELERSVSGHVVIAVPPTTGALVMPRFLLRMRQDHPNISIHAMEGVNATLLDWVTTGRADLALMHDPPDRHALARETLLREALYLVAPPGEPPRATPWRVRDLRGLRLILPAHPHVTRLMLEQAAAEAGIRLDIVLEADGVALTRNLVAAGFGHGVLTFATVREAVARGEVTATRLLAARLDTALCLVRLREAAAAPARNLAEDILRQEVAGLAAQGAWG